MRPPCPTVRDFTRRVTFDAECWDCSWRRPDMLTWAGAMAAARRHAWRTRHEALAVRHENYKRKEGAP